MGASRTSDRPGPIHVQIRVADDYRARSWNLAANPNAAFTLLRTLTPTTETEAETIDEYRLGTFELRENISLSEK
jgi:hypothetical protein